MRKARHFFYLLTTFLKLNFLRILSLYYFLYTYTYTMTDLENAIEIQSIGMDDVAGLLNWMAHQEPAPAGWTLQCGDDNEIYWDNRGNELRTPFLHLIPPTLPVEHDSIPDLTRKFLDTRLGPDHSKGMFQEFCGTNANGTTDLGNFYDLLMNFGGLDDMTTNEKASVRKTFQIAITDWRTDTTRRPSLVGEDY